MKTTERRDFHEKDENHGDTEIFTEKKRRKERKRTRERMKVVRELCG
jgi:hypothetical protein